MTCWFMVSIRSCCDLVLAGESTEDWSAAHLVIDEVGHWWGLGFSLDRCELPERSVWPGVIEVVHIDREDSAQVAFVDDHNPVEQLAAQSFRSCVRRSRSPGVLGVDW